MEEQAGREPFLSPISFEIERPRSLTFCVPARLWQVVQEVCEDIIAENGLGSGLSEIVLSYVKFWYLTLRVRVYPPFVSFSVNVRSVLQDSVKIDFISPLSFVSYERVVSLPIDFRSLVGSTGLSSIPRTMLKRNDPIFPKWKISLSSVICRRSCPVLIPRLSIFFSVTLPTPKNFRIGNEEMKSRPSREELLSVHLASLKSEATFARNLLKDTPAEAVSCNSR